MKTLVLQMARLGDILQTWPTLRALKRLDPQGELHILARGRFHGALNGVEAVDRVWQFNSKDILAPLFKSEPELAVAIGQLEQLIAELRDEGFDRVINLSFSPLSSSLVEAFTTPLTEVSGYSRSNDGYLKIPDDASAFFYAQVGPARANRIHLTDLFAHVAGVDLQSSDWRAPHVNPDAVREKFSLAKTFVLVHVGASQKEKTLSWMKWAPVVNGLLAADKCEVVLIGSAEENDVASKIVCAASGRQPLSLVGKTDMSELFALVSEAQLLIGGDSGPVHIASLFGTPVLNLSFPSVALWETGPKSPGSRIVYLEEEGAVPSDSLVFEALSMLPAVGEAHTFHRQLPTLEVLARDQAYIPGPVTSLQNSPSVKKLFQWELIRAIYMGEVFPPAPNELFLDGVRQLIDVNLLALEQIAVLNGQVQTQSATASAILTRVDEIIEQIARLVPDLSPLIRWFQTEQLRIGPMPVSQLILTTESVHRRLADVLELYRTPSGHNILIGDPTYDDTLLG
jgi:heptosyltransferase-3